MLPTAQVIVAGGWGLGQFLLAVVVVAAVLAVVVIALKQFGVTFPPWVVQIFWVCVVAVVAVIAIRFILIL